MFFRTALLGRMVFVSTISLAALSCPRLMAQSELLPDAPQPAHTVAAAANTSTDIAAYSSSLDGSSFFGATFSEPVNSQPKGQELLLKTVKVPEGRPWVSLRDCPYNTIKAPECKVHWSQLMISASVFVTFQNIGNAYTGYYYRYETTHGKWLDRYFASVTGYKFSVWSDGNPFLDDYVAHPMMGSITDDLWIQNDPKSMTVPLGNTRAYWRSRMRALAFSTAYSTQWKLGPAGESGVGHAGDHLAYDNNRYRNETGFVSLVTTPVGGLVWTVGEDFIDKYVTTRLEKLGKNPIGLFGISILTPTKTAANVLRFRPFWYRDTRVVKANSFWSDPVVAGISTSAINAEGPGGKETRAMKEADKAKIAEYNHEQFPNGLPPEAYQPGGKHEFGAWIGMSLKSGHVLGFEKNVKFMPIMLHYSYRFTEGSWWSLRYAPEVVALALIDEVNFAPMDDQTLRRRTYGSGLSPVGFQLGFLPAKRVQPFFSENSGLMYFQGEVFGPMASQLLFTTDLGVGINIFRKQRQAVTIGYRYQHMSNANISNKNPGSDADTFYLGVSRFRTKRVR